MAPPPDPQKLKVAIQALAQAGRTWDDQVEPFQRASDATTGRIDLSALEMGLAAPIHGPYQQICTGMQTLLHQASVEAKAIGDALVHAANVYQSEEDDNTHKINGVW